MAVTVTPEPGNEKNVAAALLAVADHPYQVRTVQPKVSAPGGMPYVAFEVPDDVFERFQAPQSFGVGDPEPDAAPKRRGRPRKDEGRE